MFTILFICSLYFHWHIAAVVILGFFMIGEWV